MADNKTPVVLVADDEPSMLALVSAFVRSKGYTVVEASDGDMAWQMATSRLPDLIILDVMMPGMSGWEVCRKIREAVSLAHTGVIMLTGIGESLNEMTSPLYGADAYVDKPFELGDLERTIVETLRKRREGAIGRSDISDGDERQTIRSPAFDGLPLPGKKVASSKKAAVAVAQPAVKADPRKPVTKAPAKKATQPTVSNKAVSKKAAKKAAKKTVRPAAAKKATQSAAAKKAVKKAAKARPAAAKKPAKKATKSSKPQAKRAAKPSKKPVTKAAKKKPAKQKH